MSGCPAIFDDLVQSTELTAAEILSLAEDQRPEAIKQACDDHVAAAVARGYTEDEAVFFARLMRGLLRETMRRLDTGNSCAGGTL